MSSNSTVCQFGASLHSIALGLLQLVNGPYAGLSVPMKNKPA